MSEESILNDQKKLSEQIEICRLVEETLKTRGWQEIIGPTLDTMINDIGGRKLPDGLRTLGLLLRSSASEASRYIGKQEGLIEFHNRIYGHMVHRKKKEQRFNRNEEVLKSGPETPMTTGWYSDEAP